MAGPGDTGLGKFKTADYARKELVRVGKEIGAHIPGKMDDAILAHKAMWQMLDDVVEKAMPNVRGSDIYRAAASKIDLDDLAKQFGSENVNEAMGRILKGGETRAGLANVRGYLQDVIDNTFRQGTITKGIDAGAQRLDRTIAQRLRTNLDDIVVDTAQKAGMNIDFAKLKRDYLPMRAIADAAAKADIAPFRAGGGSTTMEKLGTSLALAGLGGATGYGSGEGDTQERLKRAAITAALTGVAGVGGQALSRAAGGAATRGIASILPVASKAEKALTKIAPEVLETYGARTGGKIAAEISRAAKQEAAPATPKEEEAADTGAAAGAGDQPAYINQVMDKMRSYAAIRGVSENSEEFAQFAREVYVATEGFSPDKIGGILYPNPDERKAYLKALSAARRMSEVMPTATAERPGLLQREPEETEMARAAAIDQLAAIVGDVAKERGSEAAAKKALQKILGGRESPERKAELVRVLLAQYGVDIDALAEMGVV